MEVPFVDLLKAVNIALPWLEENTVTSIDTKHPTVSIILNKIDYHRGVLLDKSYWFNKEKKKYFLNTEGEVDVPTNVRTFYTVNTRLNYEIRDGKVYDLDNGTFKIAEAFEALVSIDIAFENLPESAANVVLWQSIIDSYTPDFGVTQSVSIMSQRLTAAQMLLDREHLRKSNFSSFRSKAGTRFLRSLRT